MIQSRRSNGVLNETTNTIHRRDATRPGLESVCGVTYTLSKEYLRPAAIDRSGSQPEITRCGNCFEDGGGY
jgi:hypothetical protein